MSSTLSSISMVRNMSKASYSTYGFGNLDAAQALERVAASGFRYVEFCCDTHAPGDRPSKYAVSTREHLEKYGLTATTVHAPARRNTLGATDEDWRRKANAVLADTLRFSGEIGAAGMVVHGIPNPNFVPQDREIHSFYSVMVDAMRRSVEELIPVAEEADVRILIENLPYNADLRTSSWDGDYPLMRMAELRPFVDDFPAKQVGLVVDVGHAWTNGDDPATEIRVAGDRLGGTHLQDVDGDNPQDNHWPPLHGGLNWISIFEALDQIYYRGMYTFEVINGVFDESADELAKLTFAVAKKWGLTKE